MNNTYIYIHRYAALRVPVFMERLAASGWCNQSGCAHTKSMRAAAKLVAEPLWMQSKVEIYMWNTSHELIFLCRISQTVTNGSQPPMQVRHSDRIHCRQREGFGRVSSSCSRNWKGLLVLYNYISGILAVVFVLPPPNLDDPQYTHCIHLRAIWRLCAATQPVIWKGSARARGG